MTELQNANPVIFDVNAPDLLNLDDDDVYETPVMGRQAITTEEVFEHIRHINDPEHPLTLEQLNVVSAKNVWVSDHEGEVEVQFTPTIPHCSMATLIGLSIRVKLLRSLPSRFKVQVSITPGTHQSEVAIKKQLNDKERVAAALENVHLLEVVNSCIRTKTD
jgi:metal-sulfur cluster biosynthetic enzyme